MMAHGIVAVSIITALLPRMSAFAAEHRYRDVAAQLSLGTRLSAVILVPATAVYILLGRQLGVALFQFRSYGHADSVATGWVIAAAGIGLVPFAISQLQIFAFYALPDTKTPALLNIPVAVLRILLDVLLYVLLAAGAVAAGLMIGNAVSFFASCAIGYWLLRRRLGPLGLREVAKTLGVGAIVTGRVIQRGDELQISVELVNAQDKTQMWGEQYNRKATDLLAVQSEISREIAERLRLKLTTAEQQRLAKRETVNPQAYELLLKGRSYKNKFWGTEGEKKAIEYFQKSIELKPQHVLYFSLGQAYEKSGKLEEAAKAYQESIKIKPTFTYALYSLALIDAEELVVDDGAVGGANDSERAVNLELR